MEALNPGPPDYNTSALNHSATLSRLLVYFPFTKSSQCFLCYYSQTPDLVFVCLFVLFRTCPTTWSIKFLSGLSLRSGCGVRRGAMMNQRAELKLLTWYSKPCNKLLFIKFLKLYRPAVKLGTCLQSSVASWAEIDPSFSLLWDICGGHYQVSLQERDALKPLRRNSRNDHNLTKTGRRGGKTFLKTFDC